MKRNQSSPFACLRALLMLPVALVIILLASACKSDANKGSDNTADSGQIIEKRVSQLEPLDTAFMKKFGLGAMINLPGKTVPPPPATSEYKTEYNVNFETDKWVRIIIDRKNDITMIAHNVTRILNSAEDIVPTLEGLKVAVERDSIDVEIKANNTIILRIPEITKTFGTPVELKRELKRLYPDIDEKVYWMVTFDVRCSTRVENDVNDIFKEEPFTDKNKVRIVSSTRIYPPMPTRRDSIRQILLGKYGSGMDRSRHVKDMKWYNANKDKEEFFRMGFKDGELGHHPNKKTVG